MKLGLILILSLFSALAISGCTGDGEGTTTITDPTTTTTTEPTVTTSPTTTVATTTTTSAPDLPFDDEGS